jgi:hypothetical protein
MAAEEQPPAAPEQDQPPATHKAFKPRRIKPSDHAKYYIVKEKNRPDIILPLDANENRRQRQLDSAEYRGLLKRYMGDKQKRGELDRMKPAELKQLGESLKIADELDRMVWVDDIPLKPRTGAVDDLEGLMESAVKAGMNLKAKEQKRQKVIDAESSDVTAEATGTQ